MHKYHHNLILTTLFLFIAFYSFPAVTDTTKTKRDSTLVTFFYKDFEKFGNLHLHANDTAITGFQNYDPISKQSTFHATLGNMGQASLNLIPYPTLRRSGFDYGIHAFDPYLYQNDSIRYYRVVKTYTELQYEQGAKKEIFFHMRFSRNLYRSLNIGADLRVMNVPGAYVRQRANHINFVLTSQFFTKDKRYGVTAYFVLNRLTNIENGGIKYDSVFEQNLETNRQLIAVNLQQATNRIRDNGFLMKHYFNLSRHPKNPKDTAFNARNHVELGRVVYTFQYNRQIQHYIDYLPKSGFYNNVFLDTTLTNDSITVTRIVNELTWSNPSFRTDKTLRVFQLEASIKQQYVEVRDYSIRNFFIQWIPSAGFSFHPYSSLLLTGYGDYVFGDYNEGDLSLRAHLSQTLGNPEGKNGGTLSVKGNYAFQKPGWFYEHYIGNHFNWDTTWKKQSLIAGSFEYSFKNMISTGLSISRIGNYTYLDSTANPAQYNKEFGYLYAFLNGNITAWRFRFVGQFAYQTVQGTNVLKLPAFLGNLTIYFTQPLFHGHAILQPGLNFNYNTAYFSDRYMPAIQSFYLQDKKETGNYIYMDVFVNIKIQRARFFLQYTHFNASFMGRNYYTVPSYPMADGALHFGISWSFHD
jgi:hypothetical protein